ncbi:MULTISPECIES: hypothetical protein [Mesotoga]|uniref:hypothetical protein n=1 Tax=Mesotoga TaxID=1184396 RepID=UPI0002CB8A21|nr:MULTISPECIES: hypothetical protein [Mesotoga]MCP5456803.1 hypothetical protein [Thermotogota bacterium]CCU86100.1 conserved exported hypothetical protein [Mesotoga infera]MCB1222731.1 hypothetical protein [Mesotoga sp.]MCP5460980.1 hypothetical protein [Thermotogota bacterium]MDK2943593.1 hypothetical protein [Mesotoga sp.]
MKRALCLSLVLLFGILLLSETQLKLNNAGWSVSADIRAYEDIYLTLALATGIPYVGVTYVDSWEEYSTGFLKLKIQDGVFRGSLLASHEGLFMGVRYVSNTNQIPIFSHTALELELSTVSKMKYLVRNWVRLPLGQLNGGLSVFLHGEDSFSFNDIGLYLYAKEYERSLRIRNMESNVVATVDLKTNDSLGEVGYGIGIGMNYLSFDPGLAFAGSFIVPAGDLRLMLSPTVMVSMRGIDAQLLISKLGSDDSIFAGISVTNFNLNGIFMRLIF